MAKAGDGIGFECFSKGEEDVFLGLFGRGSDSESESDSPNGATHVSSGPVAADATTELQSSEVICTEAPYISTIEGEMDGDVSRRVEILLLERKQLGIAHQLWPAAKFLCEYFHKHPNVLTDCAIASDGKLHMPVLELGAGIGLCGMFIAPLLQNTHEVHSIITDLPEAMDGLNENIARNQLEDKVKARVLSWGVKSELDAVLAEFNGLTPLVIAADCVYWECLYEPLFSTMKDLIAAGCKIIISHVRRWKKDGKFFAMCRKAGFSVTTVVEEVATVPAEHTGVPTRQVTRIYCIQAGTGR
jgi:predicted nicotinamide N-methyase